MATPDTHALARIQRVFAAVMELAPHERAQVLIWFCPTCGRKFDPCQYKCPDCVDEETLDQPDDS